jgi:hypothetical protein
VAPGAARRRGARAPRRARRRAAVRVRDEDALVAAGSSVELRVDGRAIFSGVEWSFAGRQRTVDVRPVVELDDGEHLARDRAAGEHEHAPGVVRLEDATLVRTQAAGSHGGAQHEGWAVSAATAASRQYASAPTALPNSSFSGAPPTSTM